MDFRRYASALAAFATILYVALLIGALGVLSLVLERDVIADPDAGILAGPIACAVAAAVVLTGLLVRALRVPQHEHDIALGVALLLGAGSYVGYGLGGAVVVGLTDPYRFLPFLLEELIGPFAAAAGILSLIVVLLDMIVLSSRIDERGRPRWPWEKRD
ncbi:DUF6121 family protein [Rathayibacter sp. CAU 1779]